MDYKPTLCLPKTDFPMKADLPRREPEIQARWEALGLYARLREARKGKELFVFHDGPPYANGDVHIGTVLNKVLKDFMVRFPGMRGFDAPFVPGWDCHGLPIEHRVMKEAGPEARTLSPPEIRSRCRKYAEHFVDHQRRQFRRLGCLGDWDHPYLTMEPGYEDGVLSVFEDLLRKGFITRDKRSTSWCPNCATALAEAELEYRDRESPSVYVRCGVGDPAVWGKFSLAQGGDLALLVWTTTPWTLPSNLAVAVNPGIDYTAARCRTREGRESWNIVAAKRLAAVAEACGFVEAVASRTVKGADLAGTTYAHPLSSRPDFRPAWARDDEALRTLPILLADYVSGEDGTGCVHTAPGHGMDDFRTGVAAGLPIFSPVDDRGRYTAEVGPALTGKKVADEANEAVLGMLRGTGSLLGEGKIQHSYAHCWRCKGPILFRATEQWFVRVDHDDMRQRALSEIESKVQWVPAWGARRIGGMVKDRPDWCISRQRHWGIPIPALRCAKCEHTWTSMEIVAKTRAVIREEGADAWFDRPVHAIVGTQSCPACGAAEATPAKDIFDVWFESGSSWRAVVQRKSHGLRFPSDAVLEGTDQHRGWFQLSLLTSVAVEGRAPWKAVVTNGFTVDEGGEKVSKSKGGLLSADEIAKEFGADVARLWVGTVEYREDVPASKDLLRRTGESYRRIRNTLRWILGVLPGFDPARDAVPEERMSPLDRWVLARLREVQAEATEAWKDCEFARGVRAIFDFCDGDLSAFYFDVSKDRFYCEAESSPERRSGQTALHLVARSLCRLLAPVLVHTTDEAWALLPGEKEPSVHLALWPEEGPRPADREALDPFAEVRAVRSEVAAACEPMRAAKTIGANAEARVEVAPADGKAARSLGAFGARGLAELFLVSEVALLPVAAAQGRRSTVTASPSPHPKCARCWNLRPTVGKDAGYPDLCDRCATVVRALPRAGG